MIVYSAGWFSLSFIWRCRGSVFPKAVFWAVPSGALAFLLGTLRDVIGLDFNINNDDNTMRAAWTAFQYMVGFLVVFRTQQAYGRYWEGALLLRQMRTEWVNAFSSILAFVTEDEQMRKQVDHFQHFFCRLVSLLVGCTLESMADTLEDKMEIISLSGIKSESFDFLEAHTYRKRSEIVRTWIIRLIRQQRKLGVVEIGDPLLSRILADFDAGVVCASKAENLTDIPFPFPYAQVIMVLLICHSLATPIFVGLTMQSRSWAAIFTFTTVLCMTGTNYIACEIESPFGTDGNDLPLVNIQKDINASLWLQLDSATQRLPEFDFDKATHRQYCTQLVGRKKADDNFTLDLEPSPLHVISKSSLGSTRSSRLSSPTRASLFANDGFFTPGIQLLRGSSVTPASVRKKSKSDAEIGIGSCSLNVNPAQHRKQKGFVHDSEIGTGSSTLDAKNGQRAQKGFVQDANARGVLLLGEDDVAESTSRPSQSPPYTSFLGGDVCTSQDGANVEASQSCDTTALASASIVLSIQQSSTSKDLLIM